MKIKGLSRSIAVLVIIIMLLVPIQVVAQSYSEENKLLEYFGVFMDKNMKRFNIPGAAFIIVRDGDIVMSGGYGYSNIDNKTRVSASETIFRQASVSKIYMSIAMLQLSEKNIIQLERDASEYVSSKKLKEALKGVTIANMMTHTEGFSSRDLLALALSEKHVPPLLKVLENELDPPVVKPGTVIAYGSYGAAIMAHILEEQTGMTYNEYIQKNIFDKLAMNKSTFLQTLPEDMEKDLAITYYHDKEKYQAMPYIYATTPPSGGLSATAEDLSKLLIAFGNNGAYNGNRLLNKDSINAMLSTQFSGHPKLGGATYGFLELYQNGKRVLVRDGSGVGVRARMLYIPEEKLGFIYCQNIRDEGEKEMAEALTDYFIDYFFPMTESRFKSYNLNYGDARRYEGNYRVVQYHRNALKLGLLVAGEFVNIRAQKDGSLLLHVMEPGDVSGLGGLAKDSVLMPLGDNLFLRSDKEAYVAFKQDDDGSVKYMFSGAGYHSTYEKVGLLHTPIFHILTFILLFIIFVAILIYAAVLYFKKAKGKDKGNMLLMMFNNTLCIIYPIIMLAPGMRKIGPLTVLAFEIPLLLRIAVYLPLIIIGINLYLILQGFRSHTKGHMFSGNGLNFIVPFISFLYILLLIYWRMLPGLIY